MTHPGLIAKAKTVFLILITIMLTVAINEYVDYLKESKLIIDYKWIEIVRLENEHEDKDTVSSPRIVARDPYTGEVLEALGALQISAGGFEAYKIGPEGEIISITMHESSEQTPEHENEYKYVAKFLIENTGNKPVTGIEVTIEVPLESTFRIIPTPNMKLTSPINFRDISSKNDPWQTFATSDVYQAGQILKIPIQKLAKRSRATLTVYWYPIVYEPLEIPSLGLNHQELRLPQIMFAFSDQTKAIINSGKMSFEKIQKIERDLLGGREVPWAVTTLSFRIILE